MNKFKMYPLCGKKRAPGAGKRKQKEKKASAKLVGCGVTKISEFGSTNQSMTEIEYERNEQWKRYLRKRSELWAHYAYGLLPSESESRVQLDTTSAQSEGAVQHLVNSSGGGGGGSSMPQVHGDECISTDSIQQEQHQRHQRYIEQRQALRKDMLDSQQGDSTGGCVVTAADADSDSTRSTLQQLRTQLPVEFDHRAAVGQLLRQPPVSLLVVGPARSGRTTLARLLADRLHMRYVSAVEVIEQQLRHHHRAHPPHPQPEYANEDDQHHNDRERGEQPPPGQRIKSLLTAGQTVPEHVTIAALLQRLCSDDIMHYGYVLDDFPCPSVAAVSSNTSSYRQQIEQLLALPLAPLYIVRLSIGTTELRHRISTVRLDIKTGRLYSSFYYSHQWPQQQQQQDQDQAESADHDATETDIATASGHRSIDNTDEGDYDEDDDYDDDDVTISEDFNDILARKAKEISGLTRPVSDDIKKRLHRPPPHFYRQSDSAHNSVEHDLTHDPLLDGLVGGHFPGDHVLTVDATLTPGELVDSLLARLEFMNIEPAMRPVRLGDNSMSLLYTDGGGGAEEDTDNALALSDTLQRNFNWRQSEYGRLCPVALREGRIAAGSVACAAGFLNYFYTMESGEALAKFVNCPRKYVRRPTVPIRTVLMGPPLSGRSTLAGQLAKLKPHVHIVDIGAESVKYGRHKKIKYVRQSLAVKLDELADRWYTMTHGSSGGGGVAAAAESQTNRDQHRALIWSALQHLTEYNGEEVAATGSASQRERPLIAASAEQNSDDAIRDTIDSIAAELGEYREFLIEKRSYDLNNEDWITLVQQSVKNSERTKNRYNCDGPHGGWILDNVPTEALIWQGLNEANFEYDEVVVLSDSSEHSQLFTRMMLDHHRQTIHRERERMLKSRAKAAAHVSTDAATDDSEHDVKHQIQMPAIRGTQVGANSGEWNTLNYETQTDADQTICLSESSENLLLQQHRTALKHFSDQWTALQSVLQTNSRVQMISVQLDKIGKHKMGQTVVQQMKKRFDRKSRLLSIDDVETLYGYFDEEDDDVTRNNQSETQDSDTYYDDMDNEMGASSSDPIRCYGDSGRFCPIQLAEHFVLQPGQETLAVEYCDHVYLMSSEEARERFAEQPDNYVNLERPMRVPPMRLVILGGYGAGKTARGRALAQETGVFFVDFNERLHEFIRDKQVAITRKQYTVELDGQEDVQQQIEELENQVAALVSRAQGDNIADFTEHENRSEHTAVGNPTANQNTEQNQSANDEDQEYKGWEPWEVEIHKYLLNYTDSLSPETLDRVVAGFWKEEPYRSQGFILEGFPNTIADLGYMVGPEHGRHLFPDAFVWLDIDGSEAVKRNIDSCMQQWSDKRRALKRRFHNIHDLRARQYQQLMERRKQELQLEKEERKRLRKERREQQEFDSENDVSVEDEEFFSDDEEEYMDSVEDIIDKEFPELSEYSPYWEKANDAKSRISDDLNEIFSESIDMMGELRDMVEDASLIWLEINARPSVRTTHYLLNTALQSFTANRTNLLYRVQPTSTQTADRLLTTGYRQLSRFGKMCPVTLRECGVLRCCTVPLTGDAQAAIFRRYVFYFASREARDKFLANPHAYIDQAVPSCCESLRLALIAPPCSAGDQLLADLQQHFGLAAVSAAGAVNQLLGRWPPLAVAEEARDVLEQGNVLPPAVVTEALLLQLLASPTAQTRGFVLDNMPQSQQQLTALATSQQLVDLVVEIQCDTATAEKTFLNHQQRQLLPAIQQLLLVSTSRDQTRDTLYQQLAARAGLSRHRRQRAGWHRQLAHVPSLFSEQQQHQQRATVTIRQTGRTRWQMSHQLRRQLQRWSRNVIDYRVGCDSGGPAPLASRHVSGDQWLAGGAGSYANYCCVCWSDGRLNRLDQLDTNNSSNSSSSGTGSGGQKQLELCAELCGRYYRLCSRQHHQLFLSQHTVYLPPYTPPLPPQLPRPLTEPEANKLLLDKEDSHRRQANCRLAHSGFCIVSYTDSNSSSSSSGGTDRSVYTSIKRGSTRHAVEYNSRVYLFVSREARDAFLQQPHRYQHKQLPDFVGQLPSTLTAGAHSAGDTCDAAAAPILAQLPSLGYLEQTVAGALAAAVADTARWRPLYPRLDLTTSALLHIGLQLQLHQQQLRHKHRRRCTLDHFERRCRSWELLARTETIAPHHDPRHYSSRLRDEMRQYATSAGWSRQRIINEALGRH